MIRRFLVASAILSPALVASPSEGVAQTRSSHWSGFSAYFENDSFTRFVGGSDDGFTNGLRIQIARHPNAPDAWFDVFDPVPHWLIKDRVDNSYSTTSFVIGQNFFTPRTITVYDPDPNDRPFGGVLFLGIRAEETESAEEDLRLLGNGENPAVRCYDAASMACVKHSQSQWQATLEVSAGVFGQGAGSRLLQAGAHVSPSSSRTPKGWHNQVPNWPHLSAFGQVRHRWAGRWAHVFGQDLDADFTPDGVVMLGTTQTYVGSGVTFRLGMNLSGFATQVGIVNAAKRDAGRAPVEAGLSAGVTGRAYAFNGFVSGVPSGDPGVAAHKLVGDYRLGTFVRVYDWRLDWFYAVRRSPEVREAGPSEGLYDSYGSIQISHDPGGVTPLGSILRRSCFGKVVRGIYLDVGFGSEMGGEALSEGAKVVRTTGFHGAAGVVLPLGFDLGYELTGIGREFDSSQAPTADHLDRLLNHKGFVVGWSPPVPILRSGLGQLRLRGGKLNSVAELEATPNYIGPRKTSCPAGMTRRPEDSDLAANEIRYCQSDVTGSGSMFGVGYTLNLGHDAGINVEASWHKLGLDEALDFSALTVGMRWTPGF